MYSEKLQEPLRVRQILLTLGLFRSSLKILAFRLFWISLSPIRDENREGIYRSMSATGAGFVGLVRAAGPEASRLVISGVLTMGAENLSAFAARGVHFGETGIVEGVSLVEKSIEISSEAAAEGWEATMNTVNRMLGPPRPQ
jgi:hypothetical protein